MNSDSIYIEVTGSGSPIALLHGWGMHGGMFAPLTELLSQSGQVICPDLPGYGHSHDICPQCGFDEVADRIIEEIRIQTRAPVCLVGWSLGGLLAQHIALTHPDEVSSLVLIATSPCFMNRSDYHDGIDAAVLSQFAGGLEDDFETTLKRFISLQFHNIPDNKQLVRRAREIVFSRPAPDRAALHRGLGFLSDIDLRAQCSRIGCRCLVIGGEKDTLVPARSVRALAERLPDARAMLIRKTGHIPFFTHPVMVAELIKQLINE